MKLPWLIIWQLIIRKFDLRLEFLARLDTKSLSRNLNFFCPWAGLWTLGNEVSVQRESLIYVCILSLLCTTVIISVREKWGSVVAPPFYGSIGFAVRLHVSRMRMTDHQRVNTKCVSMIALWKWSFMCKDKGCIAFFFSDSCIDFIWIGMMFCLAELGCDTAVLTFENIRAKPVLFPKISLHSSPLRIWGFLLLFHSDHLPKPSSNPHQVDAPSSFQCYLILFVFSESERFNVSPSKSPRMVQRPSILVGL